MSNENILAFASVHYFWSLNISYVALITTKAFVLRLELCWVFFHCVVLCAGKIGK